MFIISLSNTMQMYLGWANSIMCERGVLINGLDELQDGVVFCNLIELLTGADLGIGGVQQVGGAGNYV